MTIPTIPPVTYQVAFNSAPNQSSLPPWWSDISSRVQFEWTTERGRQYELDQNETGEWRPTLANPDGALDPSNTASPYAPNVVPYRQMRIKVTPGPNLLTPDQATAGEGTGYGPGPVPAQTYTTCGAGYPLAYVASASAYQGTNVYQVSVPNGAAQPQNLLNVAYVDAQPGVAYAAQVQSRMLSTAQNLTVSVAIDWYNSSATVISTTTGAGVALTGGSSTWVQLSAAGTAPTGTAYCQIRAVLGTTTTATALAQFDGIGFEQNSFATLFQAPNATPVNLLPRAIATGTQSIAATDTASNWFYVDTGSIAQASSLTAAPPGHTTALAWTSPVGTTSNGHLYIGGGSGTVTSSGAGPIGDCVQVTAGTTYTASAYFQRLSSADATVQVVIGYRWFDVNGNLLSTSAGSAVTVPTSGWIRGACKASAPAGAAWGRARYFISTPATTTAQNTIYSTAWQVEAAGSASTWCDPGTVYQIINGYVERWPQTWSEQDGTYGTSDIVGPDQLTALAQYTLADPFVEEVLSLKPNFFYTLADPAGAPSCADAAGNRPPVPVENSPFGPGSLTFGNSVTSASPAGGFVGTAGPVATFANGLSGSNVQHAETYLPLHKATVTPGPPASGSWTRILAFNTSVVPGGSNVMSLWSGYPASWASGNLSSFWFQITPAGQAEINVANASNFGNRYTTTGSICDGNWHQLAAVQDASGTGTLAFYLDGAQVASVGGFYTPVGIAADVLGAGVLFGINSYQQGLQGSLAHAIELPIAVSAAQMTNLYNSWRSASSGESTGARIQRILNWIGWSGPTSIATGSTASMGPATDLTGDAGLDAINSVVLTENGNFYASNQGVLTFQARSARYNQTVPAYTFGEQIAAGEFPFEVLYFDDDPSHIANNVQITQYGGSVYTAIDAASSALYFPRVYQRQINTTSTSECVDAANYLLSQYKGTGLRVSQLRLHPSAVPGLFNVCLNLELGTLIQVNRRPNGAPMISFTGFVEKVAWDWNPDDGEVFVDLQCSPVNKAAYWVLAALHTTLNAQAASGQNQATINALPDSAYNALQASLSQNTGYQLVFDPGTPIQETMTLATGGVPATNVGYSTAVLTFTSNFAHTHAAGSVACEVLPTGVTDPTTYDLSSILGATATTLSAAATSGANTITVNALTDAKTNPAGADWTTGDLIWIGVGTPNFEGYNLLSPNQSTAGEGVLPWATGTSGVAFGIRADVGTPTVTASATAFQGANVWQVSVSGGVATPTGLLYVSKTAATAGLAHTVSAYARSVTSGANPQAFAKITYLSATGATLASTSGATSTLTGSATASWTRLTATATAPTGTVWVQLEVVLTGTAPASAWTFQADGLQVEQASAASTYQTCPQILSVGASVAGYSSAVLTLAQNLANSHAVGEIVCDPLPPGATSAAGYAGSARVAY